MFRHQIGANFQVYSLHAKVSLNTTTGRIAEWSNAAVLKMAKKMYHPTALPSLNNRLSCLYAKLLSDPVIIQLAIERNKNLLIIDRCWRKFGEKSVGNLGGVKFYAAYICKRLRFFLVKLYQYAEGFPFCNQQTSSTLKAVTRDSFGILRQGIG